jgi:pimeloyl-ACP methyl ester carboxylesterase
VGRANVGPVRTYSFTRNGTTQVYHVAGDGPVMIAHSGGPGVDYSYLRSPRLEERFTMVYVEPVGTGGSQPLPEGATYVDTYVDFLHAVVEHLDVPRVFILGHSHGGVVAQRFALRYPSRVAGLALYSSTPTTDEAFWEAAALSAAAYAARHADVPEAAEAVAAIEKGDVVLTDDDKTAALAAALPVYFADFWGRRAEFEPLRQNIRSWIVDFDATSVDYRPELSRITARTVVITGRHDFICGGVWAGMLHEGITGSRLVILENSGHFGQIEEPPAFDEAVMWLLEGPDLRAAFRSGGDVLDLARAEVDRARAAADPAGEVEGLYMMARVALRDGDLPEAARRAGAALDVAVRSGHRRLEERPRHVLAATARMSGDYAVARERYLDSIALNEELGQADTVASESHNLAFVELHLGNVARARELFADSLERYRSFVPYLGVAAAALASAEGDHVRAAQMAGFTDTAYTVAGQFPDPDDAAELAMAREAAVAALGAARFAAEYTVGTALTDPL